MGPLTRREFLELGVKAVATGTLIAGCSLSALPEYRAFTGETAHRPWPLPQRRWVLFMRWHDLLFLHWPVRPDLIRPLIPKAVELDTFDGRCWIGVVPFHMSGVRPRYLPIPFAFPELNVRTYVKTPGRSGVWFFSLDAASWLAVRVARSLGLPYYDARMTVQAQGDGVEYQSTRTHKSDPSVEFAASYRPSGAAYHAAPGTLDHWLTERYSLYSALKPDEVVYGEIHHRQWPLQPAEADLRINSMTKPIGIELPGVKPICHFARYQEVVAWPIVPLEGAALVYF
ncbi:MAG: DUF2071 domain-containing protein [Deltaproteobacteria bacterium]|nr:DUF2071 domain-containing protein [Deltaproteobacteria bacterium]